MKTYVLFGGTGTLGHALAKIISSIGAKACVVSRCELRQKEMQKKYPDFQYVIGDVTNMDWAEQIIGEPYCVFNLAAMKHVDTAEHNVKRCVDIDFGGVVNTFQWAKKAGAAGYVFTGTDKSVLPINAYGMAKGLGEKYLQEQIYLGADISISICKWPNVLGSRGSVLHLFAESLRSEKKAYITDRRMTRFWLHIDDVARFMWERKMRTSSEPHIPELKASKLIDLAKSVARVIGVEFYDIEEIGIRPGEKIHEVMRTGHDYCINSENADQYTKEELDALVRRCLN